VHIAPDDALRACHPNERHKIVIPGSASGQGLGGPRALRHPLPSDSSRRRVRNRRKPQHRSDSGTQHDRNGSKQECRPAGKKFAKHSAEGRAAAFTAAFRVEHR
jgi:hypothetical protein